MTGKKLGNAVVRNRHRRWAREAFRKARPGLAKAGRLIVRFGQIARNYEQVNREFLEAYHLASKN
jgi:ribonuclease P protein component